MKKIYVLTMVSHYWDGDGFVLEYTSHCVRVYATRRGALAAMERAIMEELEDGRYTSDQLSGPSDAYAEFTDNVNGLRRPLYTLEITEQDIED